MDSDYKTIKKNLIKAAVKPHLNIFYSIEMGLQGKSWNEITSNEKNEIKKILEGVKWIKFWKISESSTLQFPDSDILNHRIIAASFVKKGSHTAQGDIYVAFFFAYQWVKLAASLVFSKKIFSFDLNQIDS